jgi:nicotinamide-nucleotide amidase
VGSVWIAVASSEQLISKLFQFDGDRAAVRDATLNAALELLLDMMNSG